MRREVVDCDRCGKTQPNTQHFCVPIGRNTDGAGSSDTETVDLDLCPECMKWALDQFLEPLSYEDSKLWVASTQGARHARASVR
jgi:hypothetical protein